MTNEESNKKIETFCSQFPTFTREEQLAIYDTSYGLLQQLSIIDLPILNTHFHWDDSGKRRTEMLNRMLIATAEGLLFMLKTACKETTNEEKEQPCQQNNV